MAGKLIRLFLTDGDADGIRTLEISSMTIKGTLFSRPMFNEFKQRSEAERPGVYMIYGEDLDSGNTKLYIGEGDPVKPRLNKHYIEKDFWTNAIVFTSKDDYLTKTQIQYLESKLISLAKKAGKVQLNNLNQPAEPNISEVDYAELSVFFENILLSLKAVGIRFFIPDISEKVVQSDISEIYSMKYKAAEAQMTIKDGKYILLKGSRVVEKETNAIRGTIKIKRQDYIKNGILTRDNPGLLLLNENLEFDSASYAAAIVAGTSINGMTAWKLNNRTLKENEELKADENIQDY